MNLETLPEFEGFDWNQGNSGKNLKTHDVSDNECESIFFNLPILIIDDPKHSDAEKRFAAFGATNDSRLLMLVFTMRGKLIRVISARDMIAASESGTTIMKEVPGFKSEDEEREFWSSHSPLDYFNLSAARRAEFPNLKPTLRSISLRLPEGMISTLKTMANRYDLPYQSLIKIMLARGIDDERRKQKVQ